MMRTDHGWSSSRTDFGQEFSVSGNESQETLNPHPDTSERNWRTQRLGEYLKRKQKENICFPQSSEAQTNSKLLNSN